MSETRYDWLTDRWVIFAPNRSKRPDEFVQQAPAQPTTRIVCPFCSGSEWQTPSAVLTLPKPSRSKNRWLVRVVPNRFPAIDPLSSSSARVPFEIEDTTLETWAAQPNAELFPATEFVRRRLQGAHEVIIESPDHNHSLTELTDAHTRLVFEAFRSRLNHWRAHDALHYAVIFKNVGPEAGASLSHTHSQLIATTFVPPDVLRASIRLQNFYVENGRSYFTDMIERETTAASRIIAETDNFVAYVPFASQIPYFINVLPKVQQARFEEIDPKALTEFSLLVRQLLKTMERLLPNAAYNFVLHTSPFNRYWDKAFHWRMELFPRLTKVAGFEWGSECFINPILPETAASDLASLFEHA